VSAFPPPLCRSSPVPAVMGRGERRTLLRAEAWIVMSESRSTRRRRRQSRCGGEGERGCGWGGGEGTGVGPALRPLLPSLSSLSRGARTIRVYERWGSHGG